MYSIGYDIGSSSVKAAIIELSNAREIAVSSYPDAEMKIEALKEGWAEQDPEMWWKALCKVTQDLLKTSSIPPSSIKSIGIAYQMHGLVLVDRDKKVLRPAIIWCDSRAVSMGETAFSDLGQEYCFNHMLNSPGNFTASKLRWVKENEPEIFERIYKILLPGDYIAMKLTGGLNTTRSGLSEAILWDFKNNSVATKLLKHFEISDDVIPELVNTFSLQGKVNGKSSEETGLVVGTPLTYRAGDQPNNAMSLNVLHPGEIAATGGTSGVVYGVSDKIKADTKSRINAFAHVNHNKEQIRIGQLLCINGAGSQYAWIKREMAYKNQSYSEMELSIQNIPVGSEGLRIIPFGNGAERMLNNAQTGARFCNIQFNRHTREHFFRAALEGIAFSFVYGINAMEDLGIVPSTIRVGNDNLFQSSIFTKTICNLLGCNIEMMQTTGAIGAAKASGIEIGIYKTVGEAIGTNVILKTSTPEDSTDNSKAAFEAWKTELENIVDIK